MIDKLLMNDKYNKLYLNDNNIIKLNILIIII